jgi:outer membrane receptor protein involved in Fe transport
VPAPPLTPPTMPAPRLPLYSAILAFAATILPLSGQTAPAPAAEEAVTLSPFEVRTDRDVGYTATSALAGGRIETPLKETPSAVSILTREFLEDIGALSFNDAAAWAPNVIEAAVTQTFGDYNVSIRSIGASFPTRNYFRWYVSSDSYNTERLEFARGPNSVLFGDANVGGVNTTWTKQALFRDRRSVQVRADSDGGYRASFDLNQAAGNRLAVRINALQDTLKGWRDYDEPTRDSLHTALTFRLGADTQFRAEAEMGQYVRTGFAETFNDQSSNWNRTTVFTGGAAPSTTGTGVARLNSTVTDDYFVYLPSLAAQGLMNWRGFFQSTGRALRLLPQGRDLANFPALPAREFSIQPTDARITTDYRTWTFYLEHRLNRRLAAQLAFNHQDQSRLLYNGSWIDQRIDVNTVLPTGGANPHFGRAFSEVTPQKAIQENELSDWRLSLQFKDDFRWVRQSVSAVFGLRHDQYNNIVTRAARVDGPNPDAQANTNLLRIRLYWDQPRSTDVFDALIRSAPGLAYADNNLADEDQSLQYNQLASTSQLFGGRLSLLLGYRYDVYARKQQRRVAANPDGSSILGATAGPGTLDKLDLGKGTMSAGAVFFPVPWIGPFFNYSESFNAPGSGAGQIDGTPIAAADNSGIDTGFKLELLGGRLSGSVSYYRIDQVGRARTGDRQADINEIWNDLGKPQQTILAFRDLESYKGSGYEFELTANLTRNWRLMTNYSIPDTEQVDIGPGLRGYFAANIDEWRAGGANPALPNAARIRQNIVDLEGTISGYTQGRVLNGTVDYTANVYTTYAFREGALKGVSIGGGANVRGRRVVANVNGQPFNLLYGDGYTTVSAHTTYERRIGRVRARFQLNVSNLLDNDRIIFNSYSFITALGRDLPNNFNYLPPRKFAVTGTFEF